MQRIVVIIAFLVIPSIASSLHQVDFKLEFGQKGFGPGQLSEPSDIAIDPDGYIYIADKGNKRIHVMKHDGKTIATWSSKKGDPWMMEEPSGIAYYKDKVYVTDSSLNKVLIFSKDGKFIDEFGSSGSKPKQFDNPGGICVYEDIIYVADTDNHRVQAFSIDGIYLNSIGTKGDRAEEMKSPTDVTTDYRGNIFVTEAGNNRVQVLTPAGRHVRSYYDVEKPVSIVIGSNGFFVADAETYKIKQFDFTGRLILSFGTKGNDHAQFIEMSGMAIDKDERIFVADPEKNTIQVFSPEKSAVMTMAETPPPLNSVKWLYDIKANVEDAVWYEDTLYATSSEQNAILVIQQSTVRKLIKGNEKERLNNPRGIAVDPQGFLWVVDSNNDRIVKLTREGKVVSFIGSSGSKEGQFSSPQGITISPRGIVYVADTGNERIQIFNTSGVFMNKIEKFRLLDQGFDKPVDVAVDALENIFVVDKDENHVVKLDPQAILQMTIGKEGKANGEFDEPNSIIVTKEEIFILDSGNHRVQVFDHKGKFLRKFGAEGKHKGDFIEPSGISAKDEISIFIADKDNKRIQAFGLIYTPQPLLQVKADAGVKEIALSWLKNTESYFSHYKVYRSDDSITFKLIGSPQEPSYTDKNVKPDTPYLYCVSVVAKEGNESGKSPVTEGRAKRLLPSPPADLKASPEEITILLNWQPSKEVEVTSYIIYREIDGMLKEIGRVKTTSFTDKELKPDTTYTFKVTAVTADNDESEAVSVSTSTILRKPPLDITVLKTHDIFPRAYKIYEKDGIGRIRVNNNSEKPLSKIKVSFITKEFMDKPAEVEIKEIPAGEKADIDLKVNFNNSILSVTETRTLQSEINVSYLFNNEVKTYSTTHQLMVIPLGKKYTEDDIKRFRKAVNSLNDKVVKAKAEKDVIKKIKEELDADENTINNLKTRNLSYGEIIVCIYLSNQTNKAIDAILVARAGGQNWQDILSSYDLAINDITYILNKIEKEIGIKEKPKPKERKRETGRGYFR